MTRKMTIFGLVAALALVAFGAVVAGTTRAQRAGQFDRIRASQEGDTDIVALRQKLGITVAHISNGGFAGYGPGFWGPGHDPFTHSVLGPDEVDMSKVIGDLGFHTERVADPSEVVPALRRAWPANASNQPAYIEFLCSQYPIYGEWVGR